jgi:hypothetical protein
MEFVRIAERQNAERAQRHKKYRRKDWVIAGKKLLQKFQSFSIPLPTLI